MKTSTENSTKKITEAPRCLYVETNGNKLANAAIASLFAKDDDLAKICDQATLFVFLGEGKDARILWDDAKGHEFAVKDTLQSFPNAKLVSITGLVMSFRCSGLVSDITFKTRREMSSAALNAYYASLKINKLLDNLLVKKTAKPEFPKFQWEPKVGDVVFARNNSDEPWSSEYYCGTSKKKICLANGKMAKQITPATGLSVTKNSVWIVRNSKLVQVC